MCMHMPSCGNSFAHTCIYVCAWEDGCAVVSTRPRPPPRVMAIEVQQPGSGNVIMRRVILPSESQVVCKKRLHIKVPPFPVIWKVEIISWVIFGTGKLCVTLPKTKISLATIRPGLGGAGRGRKQGGPSRTFRSRITPHSRWYSSC